MFFGHFPLLIYSTSTTVTPTGGTGTGTASAGPTILSLIIFSCNLKKLKQKLASQNFRQSIILETKKQLLIHNHVSHREQIHQE